MSTVRFPPIPRSVGAYYFNERADFFLAPYTRYLGYAWPVATVMINASRLALERYGSDHRDDLDFYVLSSYFTNLPILTSLAYIAGHAIFHMVTAIIDVRNEGMAECGPVSKFMFVTVSVIESLFFDAFASLASPAFVGLGISFIVDRYLALIYDNYEVKDTPLKYIPRILGVLGIFQYGIFTDMLSTAVNIGFCKPDILGKCVGDAMEGVVVKGKYA